MSHPYRAAAELPGRVPDPRCRVTTLMRWSVRLARWARREWYLRALADRRRRRLDRFLLSCVSEDARRVALRLALRDGVSAVEVRVRVRSRPAAPPRKISE